MARIPAQVLVVVLAWVATRKGRLLKSDSAENPLGARAKQVILSGESYSSSILLTYYRFFTPSAVLPNGNLILERATCGRTGNGSM